MNFKKSLIAAALLVTFSAASFAQTEPKKEKKAKTEKAPTDSTKKAEHHGKKGKEEKKG